MNVKIQKMLMRKKVYNTAKGVGNPSNPSRNPYLPLSYLACLAAKKGKSAYIIKLNLQNHPTCAPQKKCSNTFVVEVETKVYYCFWFQYSTALYKISNG